jgi:hypothetical protein
MKKLLSFAFVLIMVIMYAVPVQAAPEQPGLVELVPVNPTFPSDKGEVASESCLNTNDLEERDGKVYLKKSVAVKIAKGLLNANAVNTAIIPVFKAAAAPNGFVAQLTFLIKGKDLIALSPEDINLIGMVSASEGKLLGYVNNAADFNDGKFTIRSGGVIFNGIIDPNEYYELVVFIKDGGEFDLDGLINGKIISSIFIASEKTSKDCILECLNGCNAGYGYLMFTLIGAIPYIKKRRK